MSIKIHWGSPGSYKTSGAITDDFIPMARAGRTIVTNVRGLDDEKHIRKVLSIPDDNSFKLIYLDTEGGDAAVNAEKIERFFHWLPYGAFFLLDEAPKFFPKHWRLMDIKKLDYVGYEYDENGVLVPRTVSKIGARDENGNERPHNFITAFQQHRHYGWDMVLTSTNITNFRNEIRANAEGAYKHRNMALIGIKGRYNEGFHSAESAGKQSDFLSLRNKKIPKVTWNLYASTATGTFSDTLAGTSIFTDPKILGLLCALLCLFVFVSSRDKPAVLGGSSAKDASPAVSPTVPTALPASASAVASSQKANSPSSNVSQSNSAPADPFNSGAALKGYNLRITGTYGKVNQEEFLIEAKNEADSFTFKYVDFAAFGFKAVRLNKCLILATSLDGSFSLPISCNSRTSNVVLAKS